MECLISQIMTKNYLQVFIQLVLVLHFFLWCFKNWKIDQRTLQVQYALYSEVIHFTRRV